MVAGAVVMAFPVFPQSQNRSIAYERDARCGILEGHAVSFQSLKDYSQSQPPTPP